MQDQAQKLDHVMFAGFTHQPAIEFAQDLIAAAPEGYERVFYSDCGSASIEIALKIAFQYQQQMGYPERKRFCALENSYHGETLGALAVCGHPSYRAPFAPLLHDPLFLPSPDNPELLAIYPHTLPTLSEAENQALQRCETLLAQEGSTLAALILEPLVQCAGRFRMHSPDFLRALVEMAQKHGVLVIADEIAVAFGRCTEIFASSIAQIRPDLLCLSKGLSGGVLPLACTLVQRGITKAFEGSPERSFLHSHTYCGNPVLCAVGHASLKLLRETDSQKQRTELGPQLQQLAIEVKAQCPAVVGFRQWGNIVAFDLNIGQTTRPGRDLRAAALRHGILLRPLHDVLYWMPPFCLDAPARERLLGATIATINEVLVKPGQTRPG